MPAENNITNPELIAIQQIGIEADNFLKNNDFYNKYLKPELEHEREIAKRDGDWTPARETNVESVALYNAYNSGKRIGLHAIEVCCRRLITRGEKAGLELAKRKKVNSAVRNEEK